MARLEDPALLRGAAQFLADLALPDGCLHATFVRSPLAHARVRSIDVAAAAVAQGVFGVETAATLGLGPFVVFPALSAAQTHQPLVADTVRQVGDPLAMVLSSTQETGVDAAERVVIDLERLAPVVRPEDSLDSAALYDSVALYDSAPNLVYELVDPSDEGADSGADPLAGAHLVVEVSVVNQRVASAPLENDGILVVPGIDADGEEHLDVWCTSQGVQEIRDQLAAGLDMDRSGLRVRSVAVGGGFGGRATAPPEFVAVAAAARRHRRPVRWLQSRYENLIGMAQGRGYRTAMRIGFDGAGHITAMDVDVLADAGSWAHMSGLLLTSARRQMPGMYRVPSYRFAGRAVLTNTPPVGAYRGAGQPEANHARERVLDVAARRLGLDPVELRARNLPNAREFPFASAGGFAYDAGDPARVMQRAVEIADVAKWRAEQTRRRVAGESVEIGIGLANYAQTSGRGTPADAAVITVRSDGTVLVACASPSHGQGHRTTWAGLVSDRLGVDPSDIEVIDADSELVPNGQSTGGSRSTQVAASAIVNACADVIDAGRLLAADELEASPGDLVVVAAGFGQGPGLAVVGVPTKRVTWADLAVWSANGCLEASRYEAVADAAYPYGTHVSIVEVDTETGFVRLLAHIAVDDCGVVLQPQLVEGQQHGGSVAGISQALFEGVSFDDDGNPEAATFASYLLPAASELGELITETVGTAATGNQLGTRGIGENGCNGATAAVHNAVVDALSERGVEHLDLPLSPHRVWAALTGRDWQLGTDSSGLAGQD